MRAAAEESAERLARAPQLASRKPERLFSLIKRPCASAACHQRFRALTEATTLPGWGDWNMVFNFANDMHFARATVNFSTSVPHRHAPTASAWLSTLNIFAFACLGQRLNAKHAGGVW
ncbi:hypothetical protein KCP77_14380 [Salmonella enterica subsp. enterica]|nr:hypothetical protein KCP77_14380 [Salmonella enterica subsp. enterica]